MTSFNAKAQGRQDFLIPFASLRPCDLAFKTCHDYITSPHFVSVLLPFSRNRIGHTLHRQRHRLAVELE